MSDERRAAIDRRHPLPLWAQLHDDLLRRLQRGDFDDGVPGELHLVDEYGVSRHTVREALRRLREAGLVQASPGRRSVVAAHAIEQPLGALYSLFRAVEAKGMHQRSEVLAQEVVDDADAAARLGVDPGTALFHLARIRYADDEPLACDRVWLPADEVAPLLEVDFTHVALYDELAARCGVRITGGSERVTAAVPDPDLRSTLGLPADVACLAIDRLGLVERRPFELRHTDIRGDRWAVVAEWSPRGGDLRAAERVRPG